LRFANFFKKRKHTIIKRYPVVSRWRPDLYFTIAGIQDFQRIENGVMSFEYPANPLVVPQVCLRFSDIQNVGVTGKHFTSWMMANQTAFNWPKEGYWRDRTIELNYEFLTRILGVKKENLVYHEDVWAMGDFSEFGPSLEFFSNGLELGNNVFTQFGSVDGRVRELREKVVDVGWGFDRLLWFYSGFPTAYQVVFREQLEKLTKMGIDLDDSLLRKFALFGGELDITESENVESKILEILGRIGVTKEQYEKRIRPIQSVYAILDHVRTLLFAMNDGALPSNVGGGYNLRVLLRRALGFIERYGLDIDINELALSEATSLRRMYPELLENMDSFTKVVKVEQARYAKSKENAGRIVESLLSKGKRIEQSQLRTLYESHGVTPEFILDFAISKGIKLELPENLYRGILEGEFVRKEKEAKIDLELPELKATEKLYYRSATRSRSRVVFVHGNDLVLDRTPFYPESGGQLADQGTINGVRVRDVQKVGDVIVHVMDEGINRVKGFEVGRSVEAVVDVERRRRLIAHHTATHLINASAREVLGRHVWQEGATKDYDKARLDITHYDKLTESEVVEIERRANAYLANGIVVEAKEMERGRAEKEYGFTIYQGHGVPSKRMRIVTISTRSGKLIDAEACGGLHAEDVGCTIGMIKIIGTDRIHDGVDRIEFVAGKAALDYFEKEDAQLTRIGKELNVEKMESFEAVIANKDAYSDLYKKLDQYNEVIGRVMAEQFASKDVVELEIGKAPRELMRKLAGTIVEKNKNAVVLLTNSIGEVVCVCGESSGKSALEFAKEKLSHRGFRGGGSDKIAEGRVTGQ
jgi:alanyl-tRNA synthetase